MNKLLTHVKRYLEKYNNFCVAWYFDSRMPQTILFRSYKNLTYTQLQGKTFRLIYSYVDVNLNVSGTVRVEIIKCLCCAAISSH